ncbi:salivary glue protein Sgs-4-like [Ctenocephalides felis]|uniref:salivary glue protein Sgs-4-like n=1 Tax=Ctenocephalides felis TaxID=7515 RepID=UPI000E6E48A7|nr:salivary glue protein Sgs-4-like [Ctenocephalides felis]
MDTIKLNEYIPKKKLQEFDYEVIHRPAEKMRHVDALSQNTINEAKKTECADGLMVLNNYLIEEDWLTIAQRSEEKPKCPSPKPKCKEKPKCLLPKPKCEEKPKCPPPKPKCEQPKPKCPPTKPKCESKCRRKRTKSADCTKKPKKDDCKRSKSAGDKPSKDAGCKSEMHITKCSVEKAKCPYRCKKTTVTQMTVMMTNLITVTKKRRQKRTITRPKKF